MSSLSTKWSPMIRNLSTRLIFLHDENLEDLITPMRKVMFSVDSFMIKFTSSHSFSLSDWDPAYQFWLKGVDIVAGTVLHHPWQDCWSLSLCQKDWAAGLIFVSFPYIIHLSLNPLFVFTFSCLFIVLCLRLFLSFFFLLIFCPFYFFFLIHGLASNRNEAFVIKKC